MNVKYNLAEKNNISFSENNVAYEEKNKPENNKVSGFATHPIYTSFSSPENGFNFNNSTRTVSVSDSATYKYGYYSINSGPWQSFELAGNFYGEDTNWLEGTITGTTPELGTGEHYIIIYSCTYIETTTSWDCHGNKWQIIAINNTNEQISEIIIYAAGRQGDGAYPTMELIINNKIASSWTVSGDVNTPLYNTYTHNYNGIIGNNTDIRLNYPNDVYNSERDLRIDKIVINGTSYESESSSNINTGIWDGTNCGGIPYPGNEWLVCNGYIRYNLSTTTECIPNCEAKQCGSDGCTGTCGTCTNAHGTTECITGLCQPTCTSGYSNCDGNNINGCETNIFTSTNHCGSCNNYCSGTCTNGVCTLNPDIINTPKGTGTTYYVSNSGGLDTNTGLSESSPWQTLKNVNERTFNPGDTILFKRGDVWYGSLTIKSSGTSGKPITYGSYGTSPNKPKITGFTTITGWSNEGNGIYSKTITISSKPNIVTINNVNTPMGRWPNSGYRIFESHSGNYQLTDNELSASPDWTGAEVVVRSVHWSIEHCPITDHSGTKITYSGGQYTLSDGYGYFIQNDLRTLDSFGEWYYNNNKFYMYFGSNSPSNYDIKVSTIDQLIQMKYIDYITFDNIEFNGANKAALYIGASAYITIQNCIMNYSGQYAIDGSVNWETGHSGAEYLNVTNNIVSDIQSIAFIVRNEFVNPSFSHNTIMNTGLLPGMGKQGDHNYIGISAEGASGVLIEYNTLKKIGYIPITFNGINSKVRYNLIDTFCFVLDDGGGIYTNGPGSREIYNNIIYNGMSAQEGTPSSDSVSNGIYIDDSGAGVTISRNTAFNCTGAGIYLHNAHENTAQNNTLYNNKYSQMLIVHDSIYPDDPIRNTIIKDNILFARDSSQYSLIFATAHDKSDLLQFGASDYNYYARPIDDDTTIVTIINGWSGTSIHHTLSSWQSYTGQDTHSKKSPKTITNVNDLRIDYNPTNTQKTISLGANYIDVKGTSYPGSITIQPYSSIILIKN